MADRPVRPERPFGWDSLWWRHPPPCPADWVSGPPDVVGVGAQRCGTSWWFRQIARHPDVCFERGLHFKEVHFFDNLRHFRKLPDHYVALYARYFPRPPGAGPTCEWTPRYMFDPWAMGQLHEAAAAARILVLLRDPVARYASGYTRQMGLARQRGQSRVAEAMIEEQVARGLYSRQLERVFATFPAERVLVLQYERCCRDYDGQLDRTYAFVGVEPGFRPQGMWNPPHPNPAAFVRSDRGRALAEAYAADVARLAQLVPDLDPELWPSVRDLV
jgi:hypothetical protein